MMENEKVKAILNLVDLAGSERLTDEDSNEETGYINKSLFILSNVINKLATSKKKYPLPHAVPTSPSATPNSPASSRPP